MNISIYLFDSPTSLIFRNIPTGFLAPVNTPLESCYISFPIQRDFFFLLQVIFCRKNSQLSRIFKSAISFMYLHHENKVDGNIDQEKYLEYQN